MVNGSPSSLAGVPRIRGLGFEVDISIQRSTDPVVDLGGCQNYGPFLGPDCNTASNI